MKLTRFLLALAVVGMAATSASAQTISLSWDTCTGPINKSILPGSTATLFASIIGQATPHSGSQVWILLGAGANGPMRDAWRFDPAGCQGSSFITIDHQAPAAVAKTCPTFSQTAAGVQIKDYSYDPLTGKCQAVMANGYGAGVTTVNPATRYFLAGFTFNFLYGVNGPADPAVACGGLEVPVCAHITTASWISLADGVEHPFTIAQEFVTSNDPNNSTGCPGATPTRPTTWGSLKNTYRN